MSLAARNIRSGPKVGRGLMESAWTYYPMHRFQCWIREAYLSPLIISTGVRLKRTFLIGFHPRSFGELGIVSGLGRLLDSSVNQNGSVDVNQHETASKPLFVGTNTNALQFF